MQQYANQTDIIFDDALKRYITNIKIKYSCEIEELANLESALISNLCGQHFFRTYFRDHKLHLNYISITPRLVKPDMFALFTCLIIEINNLSSWEEVFNNPTVDDVIGQLPEDYDDSSTYEHTCVCGQHIKNICRMGSPVSRLSLIVGNCCIQKNLITNEPAQVYIKNASKRRRGAIKARKELRKCDGCLLFNVRKTDPFWENMCVPCWIKTCK